MDKNATCPHTINPTDMYERYSPLRICGRPVKANGFCGIHNPDRPVNPMFLSKALRLNIGRSMTLLGRGLSTQACDRALYGDHCGYCPEAK